MKISAIRLFAAASAALLTLAPAVRAQTTGTLTTLYSFSALDGNKDNSDGEQPSAGLVQDQAGNLYGTAYHGGANGNGTVFEITSAGAFSVLHTFSAVGSTYPHANSDGKEPLGALVQDQAGNIYGTTVFGGANGNGTIFKITPAGVFSTFYTFSADGAEGGVPNAGLILGQDGNLYGTAGSSGTNGSGTVFKISTAGVLTVVYTFSATDDNFINSDGASPFGAVAQDQAGNLYGTTIGGGANGNGTVFEISPAGVFSVLHTFGAVGSSNNYVNDDGAEPEAGVVLDQAGNLYGATTVGGSGGNGTVFKITPAGVFSVLHNFSATDSNGVNSDGTGPLDRLVLGQDGNLYGTANFGGSSGSGTIFAVTPAGAFSVLHDFSAGDSNGLNSDGVGPIASLVVGQDGELYGAAGVGGTGDAGTVFKLTLHPVSFFANEAPLSNGVDYLAFPNDNYFGYYAFLIDPHYLYHFDLGYEYVFDAADGNDGVYLYDFASQTFFYTSPSFPFPYLYDFSLNTVLYYYPDPNNPGHYNINGSRTFYDFATGQTIVK